MARKLRLGPALGAASRGVNRVASAPAVHAATTGASVAPAVVAGSYSGQAAAATAPAARAASAAVGPSPAERLATAVANTVNLVNPASTGAALASRAVLQPDKPDARQELKKLSSAVPAAFRPYLPDVIGASKKYGIPASVLLAQIGQESKFGTDPATFSGSSAGAQGVTQFMPGTASDYNVDVSNTPKGIKSQIYGQAHYMADLTKQNNGNLAAALTQYSGGYASSDYAQPILQQARQYHAFDKVAAGKGIGGGGGHPYVYPFGGQIQIGRTDMGIDPSGPGPIRAIGRAKYLGEGGSGWPTEGGSGTGPVYKLTRGPLKGKKIYTYEGITPANLRPGQKLRKGQVIARSTGSSFETGFAQGRGAGFQPTAAPHYSEGEATAEGQAFRKLVDRLGKNGTVGGGLGGASFGGASASGGSTAPGFITPGQPGAAATASAAVSQAGRPRGAKPQIGLVNLAPPSGLTPAVPMPSGYQPPTAGSVDRSSATDLGQALASARDAHLSVSQVAPGLGSSSPLTRLRRRRYSSR